MQSREDYAADMAIELAGPRLNPRERTAWATLQCYCLDAFQNRINHLLRADYLSHAVLAYAAEEFLGWRFFYAPLARTATSLKFYGHLVSQWKEVQVTRKIVPLPPGAHEEAWQLLEAHMIRLSAEASPVTFFIVNGDEAAAISSIVLLRAAAKYDKWHFFVEARSDTPCIHILRKSEWREAIGATNPRTRAFDT